MTADGILTWVEEGTQEREQMYDEEDAREWLKFWRANLRRAKRYWEMDTDTLDKIQDGELEDTED
jgi:ABC-type Fe3+ transport system substrate-binding protein